MKHLLLVFSFLFLQQLSAQKIRLKVEDQKDTTVYLIKYFGSKLFYADTAQMKNGEVIFDGAKQKPGIVGLFLPGQRYFEFVYNNEEIQLETKGPDFMANMVIKKSEENKLFIPYVKFISGKKGEIAKLSEQRSKLKPEDAQYTTLGTQIDVLNKEVEVYQANLVAANPGKLVSKIVQMSTELWCQSLLKMRTAKYSTPISAINITLPTTGTTSISKPMHWSTTLFLPTN